MGLGGVELERWKGVNVKDLSILNIFLFLIFFGDWFFGFALNLDLGLL